MSNATYTEASDTIAKTRREHTSNSKHLSLFPFRLAPVAKYCTFASRSKCRDDNNYGNHAEYDNVQTDRKDG